MASQKSRFSIFPVLKGLRKIDWLFPCFYKRKDLSFKIPTYRSSCPEVFSRMNNCLKISGNFTGKQTWWRPFLRELSCSLYQNKSFWTDFAPPFLERFFLIQYLFLPLFLIWYCHLLLIKSITTEFVAEGAKC